MNKKLWFLHDGKRIEEGIELRNGRANIGGWSTHEVWLVKPEPFPGALDEEKIADLYCGDPINLAPGYSFEFKEDA